LSGRGGEGKTEHSEKGRMANKGAVRYDRERKEENQNDNRGLKPIGTRLGFRLWGDGKKKKG